MENLNNHKGLLASVPVLTTILYIVYAFIRDVPTGMLSLLFGVTISIPLGIIGALISYYALNGIFGTESLVPVKILTVIAVLSVIHTISQMVRFKKANVVKKETKVVKK
jgi:hypothetical protein